jgi:DNA polymerase III delta subunit-like protein
MKETPLIGHAREWAFLDTLRTRGRLPAALLLAGPPMVGKTTLLERLARHILCVTGTACGSCPACQMSLDTHPDVVRYAPEEGTQARESVAALLRRIRQRPVLGTAVLVFFERVDRYSFPAISLLLKGIEDAPRYVTFFLTTDAVRRVPETIRSRALVRHVSTVPIDALVQHASQHGVSTGEAQQLARVAGGRPGLLVRLLADPALRAEYARKTEFLERVGELPLADRSAFAAELDDRAAAEDALWLFQSMLRDHLHQSAAEHLYRVAPLLRRSREALSMLRANVPPRLALEYLFFTPHHHGLRTSAHDQGMRTDTAGAPSHAAFTESR